MRKSCIHTQVDPEGSIHEFKYHHDVPLNDANHDYRVNVLEYTETTSKGKVQRFSWVTKLDISSENFSLNSTIILFAVFAPIPGITVNDLTSPAII